MKTIQNKEILIDEFLKLYEMPLEDLQQKAKSFTEKHFSNNVEFCSIISAKTGQCCEDCKYCAQSSHNDAKCDSHALVDLDTVIKAAIDAKANGASRFCIVTSGKGPGSKEEFDKILDMIKAVNNIDGLSCCCSLGIVSYDQAIKLKDAGVIRFNHNVNTAKSYYGYICSTHSYKDRIETANNIKKAGMELCCGGIIGMGETRRQRIEMALEIKDLKPTSVPINILIPIAGTPLETISNTITTEEILKTMAIYRIIMPDVLIRYAGGRAQHLDENQQLEGLKSGVNALLVGNYLTATGNSPQDDHNLVVSAGMEIIKG